MEGFRLISYASGREDGVSAGVLIEGMVFNAKVLIGERGASMMDIVRNWDDAFDDLCDWAIGADVHDGMPFAEVELRAPLLYPGTIYCAGANYADHLAEMADLVERTTGRRPSAEKPAEPWFFIKTSAASVCGEGARVAIPPFTRELDYEVELAVVIGETAKDVGEAEAMRHVAGFTILNDLSARDHLHREGSPFVFDFLGQKCFTDAAPMGPWLTPAAFIGDPQDLAITLSVNGEPRQASRTSQMVHSIAEQIAYLSRHVALLPGDVIATGTPAGVGLARGEFLQPGDTVEMEIEDLGQLRHTVVAAG